MTALDAPTMDRLRQRLAVLAPDPTSPAAVRSAVAAALSAEGVATSAAALGPLVRSVADHLVGLGPLEVLLRRPGVTDVMVNAHDDVWVEQDGRLQRADVAFDGPDAVLAAVRRVVGPRGGRLDRGSPFVDVRLADGSRLHAVGPPVVEPGPVVTLRRVEARLLDWDTLTASGAVPPDAAALLRAAVTAREAIVVCGRTGTGKTTVLQRLLSDVRAGERIVLIEDAPELQPVTPHVVRLRTRPATAEGVGTVDVADLVRQSLRMRPDRIVVGEVRGAEVADVLQALITGHEGCMTTVHARTAEQALVRLEGMALLAGLPLVAARSQLASALDVVVALDRGPDGARGVVEVARVGSQDRCPTVRTVWRREGW